MVVGFAVRAGEGVTRELSVAELADVVAVHAAGYRRAALTAWRGDTVYAVLPDVAEVDAALRAMCAEVVAVTQRRTGVRVQAGIGGRDRRGAARVRARPRRGRRPTGCSRPCAAGDDVAAFDDLRAEVLLDQTLAVLRERPDLRDPAVDALVAYDHAHGGDLAGSVLAWLDAIGDVRAAARMLTVHPNTLRYRVRRAVAVAGLRLGDPRARLVHHLALHAVRGPDLSRHRLAHRTAAPPASQFSTTNRRAGRLPRLTGMDAITSTPRRATSRCATTRPASPERASLRGARWPSSAGPPRAAGDHRRRAGTVAGGPPFDVVAPHDHAHVLGTGGQRDPRGREGRRRGGPARGTGLAGPAVRRARGRAAARGGPAVRARGATG